MLSNIVENKKKEEENASEMQRQMMQYYMMQGGYFPYLVNPCNTVCTLDTVKQEEDLEHSRD